MSINRSPLKAIRLKCLNCSNGQPKEVRLCPIETCPLWPFRSGHRLPKETIEDCCADEKSSATSMVSDNDCLSGEEEPE